MQTHGKDQLARLSQHQQRATLMTKGVEPQSGGDVDPSGAGAKRKEGVQPPGDSAQDTQSFSAVTVFVEGEARWERVQNQVAGMTLSEASKSLCESTALLLRLARASRSEDALAAQRWLQGMGVAAAIAVAVFEAADSWSTR